MGSLTKILSCVYILPITAFLPQPTLSNGRQWPSSFEKKKSSVAGGSLVFHSTSKVDSKTRRDNSGNDDNDDNNGKTGTWNPFSLAVLKLGLTEPAYTSPLNYQKSKGIYVCANCRTALFSSQAKYDSGSGWPSFWRTAAAGRVRLKREWDGRIECRCDNCGGHLGHVFPDGPERGTLDEQLLEEVPDTDPKIGYAVTMEKNSKYSRMPRFCINGLALRFEPQNE